MSHITAELLEERILESFMLKGIYLDPVQVQVLLFNNKYSTWLNDYNIPNYNHAYEETIPNHKKQYHVILRLYTKHEILLTWDKYAGLYIEDFIFKAIMSNAELTYKRTFKVKCLEFFARIFELD